MEGYFASFSDLHWEMGQSWRVAIMSSLNSGAAGLRTASSWASQRPGVAWRPHGATFLEVQNGLVVRAQSIFDLASILQQIGALEMAPTD